MIGLQERLGSAFGRDQDKSLYVPASAFDRMYGLGTGFALFGRRKPGSGLNLQEALDETRVALRTRFRVGAGGGVQREEIITRVEVVESQ